MKYNEAVTKSLDASQKKQAILQIQRCLIKQNELGDQKLDILSLMADLIENKVRELETDEHFGEWFIVSVTVLCMPFTWDNVACCSNSEETRLWPYIIHQQIFQLSQ